MSDDFFDDSAKAAEAEANAIEYPTWKWDDTPEFKGVLVDVRVQGTKDGRINFLATVEQDQTGDTFVIWIGDSPFMLKDNFEKAAPKKGTKIYVNYSGKKPTKDGSREYRVFSVFAETSDFDWWLELAKAKAAAAADPMGFQQGSVVKAEAFGPDESPF